VPDLTARDYYEYGVIRYRADDIDSAIADLTEAVRIDPQFAEAYLMRGVAHGDTPAAIEDFSEAIRLNPSYIQAYYNRGLARGSIGDYAGAIDDFTKVLQLNPNHPQWRNLRLDIAEWRKRL
jgi:tetratricopeptide (TPR) repeat protein